MTIMSLLVAEQTKRSGSFKIGVFAITLVIGSLVLVFSLTSLTGVVFYSLARNSKGVQDFILRPVQGQDKRIDGNLNFYSIDPFDYRTNQPTELT